jgi:hypothetical protein
LSNPGRIQSYSGNQANIKNETISSAYKKGSHRMLFLEKLSNNCQRLPNKPAIVFLEDESPLTVTYGELETAVTQTMHTLF